MSLSVAPSNLSQSLFFLFFFVLSCCVFQPPVPRIAFSSSLSSLPSAHYRLLSLSLAYSLFLFPSPCVSHLPCSLLLLFLSVCHCCSLCLCSRLPVTFGISLFPCLSVCLPLFLVPSLTLFSSPCARLSVCFFSWCLKLPLLQSGCRDSGPKLPALGPRPLHFLNPLQLVSRRRAGCRENRKEVDSRGLGSRPLSALPAPGQ